MSEPLEWTARGPLGEVVLKRSTLDYHIQDDHLPADAEFRMKITNQVKSAVTSPRFIINDTASADADGYARAVYMDCELCEDKLKLIYVFVEERTSPKEVVTFLGSSKGIKFEDKDVIYDRKGGSEDEVVDSI